MSVTTNHLSFLRRFAKSSGTFRQKDHRVDDEAPGLHRLDLAEKVERGGDHALVLQREVGEDVTLRALDGVVVQVHEHLLQAVCFGELHEDRGDHAAEAEVRRVLRLLEEAKPLHQRVDAPQIAGEQVGVHHLQDDLDQLVHVLEALFGFEDLEDQR